MDFEAMAKEAAAVGDFKDNEAFIEMLASALEVGFVKGRESMKDECIEVVKGYIPTQDYAGNYPMDDLIEEIKRL